LIDVVVSESEAPQVGGIQPSECDADVQKLGRCRRVLVLKSRDD
jgi:hypothetical protein